MAKKNGDARLSVSGRLAFGLTLLGSACGTFRGDVGRRSEDGGVLPPGAGGSAGFAGAGGAFGTGSGGGIILTPPPPCELADPGADAERLFRSYAVSHDDVGRRVFYSWTTTEQLDELRAVPTLLTRSLSSTGQRGRAADYILNEAIAGGIPAILARSEFEKKRFGWSNAWATILGWEGETYGEELLEIRLRQEAWVGRVLTSTGEWTFFDVDNRPVSLDAVMAEPHRIGAVYFVDDSAPSGCGGGSFAGLEVFREWFVCNEGMLESWSARTVEIRDHLAAAIAALRALRAALPPGGCTSPSNSIDFCREVMAAWAAPAAGLLGTYEASLSFPNSFYIPTPENLNDLINRLEALLFDLAPLRHTYLGDAAP